MRERRTDRQTERQTDRDSGCERQGHGLIKSQGQTETKSE